MANWPAQIAQVAMWLIDHQMNMRISEEFGEYFVRLPLKKSATIIHGNALRIDWETIVKKDRLSYILGNPPFVGKQYQSVSQKSDIEFIFSKVKGAGVLDYVTCWYIKAAQYIQGTQIKVAFVSTNSISQGEQSGVLDARAMFPSSSLADLYNPLTMPPALVKAHQVLDKAVDKCYRPAPFDSETKRIEYLFELYEKYTAGLFAGEGKKKKLNQNNIKNYGSNY